ncbi:hypothetical protein [Hyphomonas beringensis]|nr:hypothetical protein [Hyphomonas beringensis]
MRSALPAPPLLGFLASACLLGFGVYIAVLQPVRAADIRITPSPPTLPDPSEALPDSSTYHQSHASRPQARMALLQQSPFVENHTAFNRYTPIAPKPAQPSFDPEFMGVLGRKEKLRIMIRWRPNDEVKIYSLGEETPWGELKEINGTDAVFSSPEGEKRLKLF